MNKLLAISIILCSISLTLPEVFAYTITTNTPTYSNTMDNAYSNDLSHIEEYLFGKTYRSNSIDDRLKRIENKLFNKTYTSMNTTNRMNNILTNYRNTNSTTGSLSNFITTSPTGSGSYFTRSGNFSSYTPRQRLYNRFIGQPTGFTPPIMNSPFHRNSFPGLRPGVAPGFRAGYRHRPHYGNKFGYYRPRRVNNTYGTRTYYGTPSYLQPTSARAGITILD